VKKFYFGKLSYMDESKTRRLYLRLLITKVLKEEFKPDKKDNY